MQKELLDVVTLSHWRDSSGRSLGWVRGAIKSIPVYKDVEGISIFDQFGAADTTIMLGRSLSRIHEQHYMFYWLCVLMMRLFYNCPLRGLFLYIWGLPRCYCWVRWTFIFIILIYRRSNYLSIQLSLEKARYSSSLMWSWMFYTLSMVLMAIIRLSKDLIIISFDAWIYVETLYPNMIKTCLLVMIYYCIEPLVSCDPVMWVLF